MNKNPKNRRYLGASIMLFTLIMSLSLPVLGKSEEPKQKLNSDAECNLSNLSNPAPVLANIEPPKKPLPKANGGKVPNTGIYNLVELNSYPHLSPGYELGEKDTYRESLSSLIRFRDDNSFDLILGSVKGRFSWTQKGETLIIQGLCPESVNKMVNNLKFTKKGRDFILISEDDVLRYQLKP